MVYVWRGERCVWEGRERRGNDRLSRFVWGSGIWRLVYRERVMGVKTGVKNANE